MPLLLLIVVAGLAWLFIAPGQRFLPELARLLTEPVIKRRALGFLSGRTYATGRFDGREVAIRLQLKRSRYDLGYLVIAVRTGGPATLDYTGIDVRTRDDAGRRALVSMAANDLVISVEDGWLKALWKPVGFIVFPGRFSEDKWRRVLEAMNAVASSLEASAESVIPETGVDV